MRSAIWSRMLVGVIALLSAVAAPAAETDLERNFQAPPAAAKPWVYWFWLNSNITREGITADLEAMQRVGIGGVLIMEVDQGAPVGPAAFAGKEWRELYQFMLNEAARLGLEVNMNNDAGWCGSGGPWITPELSMQYVVGTETAVTGGKRVEMKLPQPPSRADYYRDITVLAFPTPAGNARIDQIMGKNAQVRKDQPPAPAKYPEVPADQVIKPEAIVDLSAHFKDETLTWDAPAGEWTVLRLGHTSTGQTNLPSPASGRGLECDKLSKAGADAAYAGLMGKIIADSPTRTGKTLVTVHIDSWEVHSQNWTTKFREEFQQRRGYDLYRYLPVYTGRIVGSVEVSERFLWDLRQTTNELLLQNYAARFRELANKDGLKLSIEAYGDCNFDNLTYAGQCDEPMGEFWAWAYGSAHDSCTEMTSAGHTYGKRIIGAEAFTANNQERWLGHPGMIKSLGDWAFCEGINRFVFHRYALQPWPKARPGMSMGPWGLHYEHTQTWWDESAAWHLYLARCQQLLREGLFVADICYLQPEGSPRRFSPPVKRTGNPPDRPGYNFDGCSADVVLHRMSVRDGRLVLPDGMSYRLLALPEAQTMTPQLLKKIVTLVEEGATVVGPRPQKSPSLEKFPACDQEIEQLAAKLWGDCDGQQVKEHRLGKGRVIWGDSPEQVLTNANVPADFAAVGGLAAKVRYIHRTLPDGVEVYFIANKREASLTGDCGFRVAGKSPELWYPESGRRVQPAQWQEQNGVTTIPLYLEAAESVFVVFRPNRAVDPVVKLTHNGQPLGTPVIPAAKIAILKATYGVPNDPKRTRNVKAKVEKLVAAEQYQFAVSEMAKGDDPAFGVVKTLTVEYTVDGKPRKAAGNDKQVLELIADANVDMPRYATLTTLPTGKIQVEAWQAGRFDLQTAAGKTLATEVKNLPTPLTVAGPWELKFPASPTAPQTRTLTQLSSWHLLADDAAKYYSGTATYQTKFTIPATEIRPDRGLYLDLGKVAILARVKLNGRDLGVLWKAPYRVAIDGAAQPGENTLEVTVTNLWINRLIGDENLPEDSERNPNGTLKAWPEWLLQGKASPTGRQTFTSWRLWKKDAPLQESGLLGPVTVQPTQRSIAQ